MGIDKYNSEIKEISSNLDVIITDFSVYFESDENDIFKSCAEVYLKFIYKDEFSEIITWYTSTYNSPTKFITKSCESSGIIDQLLEFIFQNIDDDKFYYYKLEHYSDGGWHEIVYNMLEPCINKIENCVQNHLNTHDFKDKANELLKSRLIEFYRKYDIESKNIIDNSFDEYIVTKIMKE